MAVPLGASFDPSLVEEINRLLATGRFSRCCSLLMSLFALSRVVVEDWEEPGAPPAPGSSQLGERVGRIGSIHAHGRAQGSYACSRAADADKSAERAPAEWCRRNHRDGVC
jgi:hypothetical protein